MRIGGKGSFVDNAHAGGVYIGVKPGDKLKQKAELAGGVVLILIGIKMVLI